MICVAARHRGQATVGVPLGLTLTLRHLVLDALASLIDKSLLVADETGGNTRYRLLVTIRQCAQDRLEEAGGGAVTRQRHADEYAAFARVAGEHLRGRTVLEWSRRAERELDSIRPPMTWLAEIGDAQTALDITLALSLSAVGSEGVAALDLATTAASVTGAVDDPRYPTLLGMLAQGNAQPGDLAAADGMLVAMTLDAERLGVALDQQCYFYRAVVEMYLGVSISG